MHKDPTWKALPDCKEQQQFYAQAASFLGVVKGAWRNYTAHAHGVYTQEEAELMLLNVRSFMERFLSGWVISPPGSFASAPQGRPRSSKIWKEAIR
jgi:hypothetical protein